jgi:hypothetical protein
MGEGLRGIGVGRRSTKRGGWARQSVRVGAKVEGTRGGGDMWLWDGAGHVVRLRCGRAGLQ